MELIYEFDMSNPFVFIMILLFIHFFLGMIVFSGLNYAMLFSPIIFAFISLLRKLVNSCFLCCYFPEEWRESINGIFDDVLKAEPEDLIVGEVLEGVVEEQNQEEINMLDVSKVEWSK